MTTPREIIARAVCHYNAGPSEINSCCQIGIGKTRCQKHADGVVFALRAAGYAVVPIEPTEAMKTAGGDVALGRDFDEPNEDVGYFTSAEVWSAMLAASEVQP